MIATALAWFIGLSCTALVPVLFYAAPRFEGDAVREIERTEEAAMEAQWWLLQLERGWA
jgi:hypothetical protein